MKKNYIAPLSTITVVELTLMNGFSKDDPNSSQNVTVDPNEEANEFTTRRKNDVWDDEEEEKEKLY